MTEAYHIRLHAPPNEKFISANSRTHWGAKAKSTKTWRTHAKTIMEAQGLPIPPLSPPVSIVVQVHRLRNGGKQDALNVSPTIKAAIDGFIDAGILEDDSDEYIQQVTVRRGLAWETESGTRIETLQFWFIEEGRIDSEVLRESTRKKLTKELRKSLDSGKVDDVHQIVEQLEKLDNTP